MHYLFIYSINVALKIKLSSFVSVKNTGIHFFKKAKIVSCTVIYLGPPTLSVEEDLPPPLVPIPPLVNCTTQFNTNTTDSTALIIITNTLWQSEMKFQLGLMYYKQG